MGLKVLNLVIATLAIWNLPTHAHVANPFKKMSLLDKLVWLFGILDWLVCVGLYVQADRLHITARAKSALGTCGTCDAFFIVLGVPMFPFG